MFTVAPIAFVRSPRREVRDDSWGNMVSIIELSPEIPAESLDGLEDFSHLEVLFIFDRVEAGAIVNGSRHPRDNPAWPKVGIFAQRAKCRPNRIGATIVVLLSREGRRLTVGGLDAIDRTPVLDIKPVIAEFLPRTPVRQPPWTHEVMADYWKHAPEAQPH